MRTTLILLFVYALSYTGYSNTKASKDDLERAYPRDFFITVEHAETGKRHRIFVKGNWTIKDLKREVWLMTGDPEYLSSRYYFKEKELIDSRTIIFSGIKEDDIVHVGRGWWYRRILTLFKSLVL